MSTVVAFIQNALKSCPVVLFTKSYCPYCVKAKTFFTSINQDFKVFELDQIDNGVEIQAELTALTGQRTVPCVFIHGKFIGGYDTTQELHRSGVLQNLLEPKQL